jgi:RimJ/RimL family protein N-acetyltransferase
LSYFRLITAEPNLTVLETDEFPATDEEEREWLQDHLDEPGKIVLVAEADGTIIGNVSLEVFATNSVAIRLYKKLGFAEEGLRPREVKFGPGRYVDGVAMYRFVK